jgi:phage tail sheath protein FI
MPVVQQGSINTAALVIPDVYVQIMQPPLVINGLPTNILGIVGTASWGPTNSPVILGDLRAAVLNFGSPNNRKYDLVTGLWAAALQGANNFRAVRVTDGTDVAASVVALTNCITFTAKYTGTLGNSIQVSVAPGSQASTQKVTVALPGYVPEVFDNIGAGLSGNALWIAIANAINNGLNASRGASALIVASAGVGTTAPAVATYSLASGTDGAATITGTVLIGQDTVPRKGMYCLRNTGASVAFLVDCDDSTTWATQVTFGLSEGVYMVGTGPAGDTISNAVSAKSTAGIDSYAFKLAFGDWVYFNDAINGLVRLISPQGFLAGRLANLSPEQSSLNKQVYGVVGTQKSYANQVYSSAELQTLAQAGIDVVTNPIPAGAQFGARFGHNSSSNFAIHGDNYTRMTNFLAYTLSAAMGLFVGRLQSQQPNDATRREVKSTIDNFLETLIQQKMIDTYQTQCDLSNNPPARISAGYLQVDVKVRYLSVVEYLVVNLEGGQTVVINRVNTSPAN